MKLAQQESFSPIALILETREEAELFWHMIRESHYHDDQSKMMAIKISNLFSNEAHL